MVILGIGIGIGISRMYDFKEPKDAYDTSRGFVKKKKLSEVIGFPPYVTFELLNACNFRCKICPSSYMKRKKNEMDLELFKKTVDEIAKYGSLVRFIGFAEPLLYGKIKEAIGYVKSKNLLLHITTNGSLLNGERAKTILDNKVDSLIFSFQGLTEEEYCFMRNLSQKMYLRVIANIEALCKSRVGKKPFVKVTTTITNRDRETDKSSFVKKHLSYMDEVQISGFTHLVHIAEGFNRKNIWEELGVDRSLKVENAKCFIPNYELLIKSDGGLHLCCGAYTDDLQIGNIKDDSLFNLWHSRKANEIRRLLNQGKLENFKTCAACSVRYEYENINSTLVNTRQGKGEKYV